MHQSSSDCPIEFALEIIGKKWTVLILRELMDGKKRFTELSASLPISTKCLTCRLKELESHGIIHRHCFAETPPRVEYSLTESGKTLEYVLQAIQSWGVEHMTTKNAR